jgi:glycosyltransferase involved in cell wall biosynthesis
MKRIKLPAVSLVISLYNNQRTARRQLDACYRLLKKTPVNFEMVLCNDASSDGTLGIIKEFSAGYANVRIINHTRNLGIAASLKDLYRQARKEYIMLYSADGEWNPQDLVRLVKCQAGNQADAVIGYRPVKQYGPARKAVSYFYNLLPWILFGVRTYDTGSIKIFRADLFRKRRFISRSVFFEAEMLIEARRRGGIIKAVNVSHRPKLNHTKSGVNFKAVIAACKDVIRLKINQ